LFSPGGSFSDLGHPSRRRLFVHHRTKGQPADFIEHLSAIDPNLIQLKEFIDGFDVSFPRLVEEAPPLVHFFFFGMRGSPSLHAQPFLHLSHFFRDGALTGTVERTLYIRARGFASPQNANFFRSMQNLKKFRRHRSAKVTSK